MQARKLFSSFSDQNKMESELPSLKGKVCIVTGASRGIGKGIALMLAKAGATVYITGRTLDTEQGQQGSLRQTAKEIDQESGGCCIPIKCDHRNDEEVKKLFEKVSQEQNGQLDILVNNAYQGARAALEKAGTPFYELSVDMWDEVNNVGLRSNYVAAWHAAKIMVPAKQGLIVNMSSPGGLKYSVSVAYGVGKAATDRMAADMAVELRKHNVACVSLWPGAVKTEAVMDLISKKSHEGKWVSRSGKFLKYAEDVTFSGKAVALLAVDKDIMKKTGRILISPELAREYGFKDVGGTQPLSMQQVKFHLASSYPSIAWMMPEFVYIPAAVNHKL